MLAVQKVNEASSLETEILFYKLQGERLAEKDGIPPPCCVYCGGQVEARDHIIPFRLMRRNRNHQRRYKGEGILGNITVY